MPSTSIRQQMLSRSRSLVVKVGTQLLTGGEGRLNTPFMNAIARQLAELAGRGIQITLVSSGAVGFGCRALGMAKRPKDIALLQGVAAIGQVGLMHRWHEIFKRHGMHVAQMLLNRDDFEDRTRYLNIRNCITELHAMNAIPIVNENDTVTVDEIRFGDNDVLAAQVTNAIRAEVLVLLSVIDGLTDGEGVVQDIVQDVAAVRSMAHQNRTAFGSGGMITKLEAARIVTDAGEAAVIANGRRKDVLLKLLAGEKVGTLFVPAGRKMDSRQRWIAMTVRPTGVVIVDDGAAAALAKRNCSLLATGITEVTGNFGKGDVVVVRDLRGRELARGLINYSAAEARQIKGHRSTQFEKLLGRRAYDEVIHRDNMVVTHKAQEGEVTNA